MSSNLVQVVSTETGVEMNLTELIEQLDKAIAWLTSWGFNVSPTRVAKYKSYLLNSVGEEVSVLEFESVMYDISELLFIYNAINNCDDKALEPLLADLVKGQVRKGLQVGDERARNFEFELKVIAKYFKLGFELDLTTNADLIVKDQNGSQLLIECKRLTSNKKLGKRINEAAKQLHKKYQYCLQPMATRGLIFLDISNLVNTEFKIIRAETYHEAERFLGGKVDEFANKNYELWNSITDLRTWGVVLYCSAPTKIDGRLSTVSRVFHVDLSVVNPEDRKSANVFVKHFIEPNQKLYNS